jgi:hypothetical protein
MISIRSFRLRPLASGLAATTMVLAAMLALTGPNATAAEASSSKRQLSIDDILGTPAPLVDKARQQEAADKALLAAYNIDKAKLQKAVADVQSILDQDRGTKPMLDFQAAVAASKQIENHYIDVREKGADPPALRLIAADYLKAAKTLSSSWQVWSRGENYKLSESWTAFDGARDAIERDLAFLHAGHKHEIEQIVAPLSKMTADFLEFAQIDVSVLWLNQDQIRAKLEIPPGQPLSDPLIEAQYLRNAVTHLESIVTQTEFDRLFPEAKQQ